MTDTKAEILRVAAERYLASGLSGISLRKVAKDVGISATAIYRHFEHKQALVFALVADGYRDFSAALRSGPAWATEEGTDAAQADPSVVELQRLAARYTQFVLDKPQIYALLFLSTHHLNPGENEFALPPELQALGRDALWILVHAVEAAMAAGCIRPMDALTASRILWAQLHGVAALHIAHRLGASDSAFVALSRSGFDAALAGLTAG